MQPTIAMRRATRQVEKDRRDERPHRICLDFPTRQDAIDWFQAHGHEFTISDRDVALFELDGLDRIADSGGITPSRTLIVKGVADRGYGLVARLPEVRA